MPDQNNGERITAEQLMLYANNELCFSINARNFEKENPGKNRSEPVNAPGDLGAILDKYEGLTQINFYAHGRRGSITFPGGAMITHTVGQFLKPHPDLFDGEGRVLFIGCNVAEGYEGRDFLIATGQALLPGHGGFVGGTTSMNIVGRFGWPDVRMPFWGDLRVLQFNVRGKMIAEKAF